MKRSIAPVLAALLLAAAGVASPAFAQPPAAPVDAMTDPALKREEVVAFIGLKPGQKIADIIAGRFVRAFSGAVGPNGKVYAVEPAEIVKAEPQIMELMK